MSENFYIQTISIISLFIINYLKVRADNRIYRKKSEKVISSLTKKLEDIESIVIAGADSRELIDKLDKAISKKGFEVISANTDLGNDMINVLNMFQIKVKKFAISYFESQFRVNKNIVEDYIQIEMNTIMEFVKHTYNDNFKGVRKNLTFFENIEKITNSIVCTNVLIHRLIENGLSSVKYRELFEKYIADIFKEHIKGYRLWIRMKE